MSAVSDFKNIHRGKRLFILASGPSLGDHDLSPLKRRLVMGLNRSFMVYPDTQYHCMMDHRLFDMYEDLYRQTRYLFTLEGRPWGIPMKLLGSEGFSFDLEKSVYSGYTISYVALQLAVYMGFNEIVFLGLDLQHRDADTHFFGQDFHSRMHEQTEFPRMARMLSYGVNLLNKRKVTVYNCSPVCTLDCFARISYDYAISL